MNPTEFRNSSRKAIHIIVKGQVQGVGFRYFTRLNAQRQGVVGWVRNNADGTVEIWAEGTAQRLKPFIDAVRRGPSHSFVRDVNLKWTTPTGEHHSFQVRY